MNAIPSMNQPPEGSGFIQDGMNKAVPGGPLIAPQLSAWHEAGHLYTSSDYSPYGLKPGTKTTLHNGQTLSAAQIMRDVHVTMKQLCDQVAG